MIAEMDPAVIAVTGRLEEGVILRSVVVVNSLGQQCGQDVRQR